MKMILASGVNVLLRLGLTWKLHIVCEVRIQREENAECDVICDLQYQSNQ